MHLNTTNAFLPQKTIRVKKHDELYLRIQNKKLLGAPGLTTRNKKPLGAPCLTTKQQAAMRVSWHRHQEQKALRGSWPYY